MIQQVKIELKSRPRGCHLVTREITEQLPKPLPEAGLMNLFVQHTSCALSINENADPDVRTDLAKIMDRLVKENEPYYNHTLEGADDMPAHAKCSMFGVSLTIPITQGRLNLGTWQGIYLCEFRDYGGARKVIATIYS
jgi:secondary thiamine-phosphate synthase enzyme